MHPITFEFQDLLWLSFYQGCLLKTIPLNGLGCGLDNGLLYFPSSVTW